MTPMGSRPADMRPRRLLAAARGLLTDALQRARDVHHLRVRKLLGERVGDPVDGARGLPRDEAYAVTVEIALVGAAAHAHLVGRVVEDRRRHPGRALDAVVLAVV